MGLFMFLMAKTQIPKQEEISIFCSLCGKEADEGFLCPERELIICLKCHEHFKMERCPHIHGEHKHIRWPGFKDKNIAYMDEIIKISKEHKNSDGIR
jgi:hypothetical protein